MFISGTSNEKSQETPYSKNPPANPIKQLTATVLFLNKLKININNKRVNNDFHITK